MTIFMEGPTDISTKWLVDMALNLMLSTFAIVVTSIANFLKPLRHNKVEHEFGRGMFRVGQ